MSTPFANITTAIQQGNVGDTINGFSFTYDRNDVFEIVWIAPRRRTILAKKLGGNLWKFAELSRDSFGVEHGDAINDSFIGDDWTTERILDRVVNDWRAAEGVAQADAYR
jgi:hypothetical protein